MVTLGHWRPPTGGGTAERMKMHLNLHKDDLLCPWMLYLFICSLVHSLIHIFMMIMSSGQVKPPYGAEEGYWSN